MYRQSVGSLHEPVKDGNECRVFVFLLYGGLELFFSYGEVLIFSSQEDCTVFPISGTFDLVHIDKEFFTSSGVVELVEIHGICYLTTHNVLARRFALRRSRRFPSLRLLM